MMTKQKIEDTSFPISQWNFERKFDTCLWLLGCFQCLMSFIWNHPEIIWDRLVLKRVSYIWWAYRSSFCPLFLSKCSEAEVYSQFQFSIKWPDRMGYPNKSLKMINFLAVVRPLLVAICDLSSVNMVGGIQPMLILP